MPCDILSIILRGLCPDLIVANPTRAIITIYDECNTRLHRGVINFIYNTKRFYI